MQIRGRILRMAGVGAVLVTTAVGFDAVTASAASAPASLQHGPSVKAHPSTASGSYELYIGGSDFGTMELNSDTTLSLAINDDTGVWITTGNAFSMSITSSDVGDTGCTFSGTVNKKGINAAKPKKQGNYVCPGSSFVTKWYALKTLP